MKYDLPGFKGQIYAGIEKVEERRSRPFDWAESHVFTKHDITLHPSYLPMVIVYCIGGSKSE